MRLAKTFLPLVGLALFGTSFGVEPNVKHTWAEDYVANLPKRELSQTERDALLYMVEEEKLARDVYLTLYEKWRLPVFRNIARSEQHHMNMVRVLLEKYGLPDPTKGREIGEFQNKELQELYNRLVKEGERSLIDALKVGALIEELDIKDLEERLKQTDNEDIKVVFKNLMKGSRNHLRAFARLIERFGGEYKPTYLSEDEVKEILSKRIERGFIR